MSEVLRFRGSVWHVILLQQEFMTTERRILNFDFENTLS
jgi:hypothetical protein